MAVRALAIGLAAAWSLAAPAATHGGADALSLAALVELGVVDVAVDLSRFDGERVAALRITNREAAPVSGWVPACTTVFATGNPADSPVRPSESGPFAVKAGGAATLVRLLRAVDGTRRVPSGAVYRLELDGVAERGCRN